jgi:nicotinate-nucleotide adenylyltransferase
VGLTGGDVEDSGGSSRSWGILGGTFDPIHCAHLAIAEQTRQSLDLEGVLFVPAGVPPHKGDMMVTPVHHRIAMVELAIAGNPGFRLSRVEADRAGRSYSVDTVAELRAGGGSMSDAEPVFILSAEALRDLPSWHEPERLLSLCRLAVVPRRGYPPPARAWVAEHFPGREERFIFLDGPDLGHSASDIRHRASAGLSVRYLVPDAVRDYIARNQLYPPELWAKN